MGGPAQALPTIAAPDPSPSAHDGTEFRRRALLLLLLRVASSGLGLGTAIVLSRALGSARYGAYAVAAAWSVGLGRPAALGAELLLTRQVAVGWAGGALLASRELVARSARTVALASGWVAAGLAILLLLSGSAVPDALRWTLLCALPALPATALTAIPQGILLGSNRPAAALLPSTLFRQITLLGLVGLGLLLWGPRLSSTAVAAALALAAVIALAGGALMARRLVRPATRDADATVAGEARLRGLTSLAVIDTSSAIQAICGVTLLGLLGDASDAGRFAAATQLVAPIALVLSSSGGAISPRLASLSASRDEGRLQTVVTTSTRAVAAVAAVIGLLLIVLADPLLGLFGSEFARADSALRLVVIASVVNACVPFNTLALVMAGRERVAARASSLAVLITVLLSVFLIPAFGLVGAAWAFLVAATSRNLATSVAAWRQLGLDTSPLGLTRRASR